MNQSMESDLSRYIFCEKCFLKFENRNVLNMHKNIVHKIKVKPIENEKCNLGVQQSLLMGKQTISVSKKKSSASLKMHKVSVHEQQKSNKCSMCHYSFSQKSSLKTHMESVHDY